MTIDERVAAIVDDLGLHSSTDYPPRWAERAEAMLRAELVAAVAEEKEACIADVAGAMADEGTDDPHRALDMAIAAIRARTT